MGCPDIQPVTFFRTSCVFVCRTIFPIVGRIAGLVVPGSLQRTVMRKGLHETSWKNSTTLSGGLRCAVFGLTQRDRFWGKVGGGSFY